MNCWWLRRPVTAASMLLITVVLQNGAGHPCRGGAIHGPRVRRRGTCSRALGEGPWRRGRRQGLQGQLVAMPTMSAAATEVPSTLNDRTPSWVEAEVTVPEWRLPAAV